MIFRQFMHRITPKHNLVQFQFLKEPELIIFRKNGTEPNTSHILNNGEVPELFSTEEKAKAVEEMEVNNQSSG